jgi:hypothetical protein
VPCPSVLVRAGVCCVLCENSSNRHRQLKKNIGRPPLPPRTAIETKRDQKGKNYSRRKKTHNSIPFLKSYFFNLKEFCFKEQLVSNGIKFARS